MIDVYIREFNGKLQAICTIKADDDDEFYSDVATLKKVPPMDRTFNGVTNEWTLFDAEKHRLTFHELTTAVDEFKKQLKMF